jgi:hypothetical protein
MRVLAGPEVEGIDLEEYEKCSSRYARLCSAGA